MWLFGERDTLVPVAAAEAIAALAPTARHALVHGAGHAPFLSHPQETAGVLAAFLSEIGW